MTKVLIEIEGQQIPVDAEIAQEDDLLRQLLRPYYPDASNARIDRKEGEIIKVVKVAGPKGITPLETLLNAPETVNPALVLCRIVQRQELTMPLGYADMKELVAEIDEAIEAGSTEVEEVNRSLKALQKSAPIAGDPPIGF